MTIRRRLARSNLVMILIPVAIAALHETGEQLETAFAGAKALAAIYAGTVILALLATVAFTNFYLTRSLFRHISAPLQTLVAGVERIRGGDLESPIGYTAEDEFKPACDAVDAMAARLKASLDAQSRQQQRQELIAGMSHDLKSPLTSIRAYTEGLLDGVAKDEAARTRYIEKPFSPSVLVARVKAHLAQVERLQPSPAEPAVLTVGPLTAKLDARQIFKNGVELPLKNREYELLLFLMRHPGQVFSREDLYEMIWGLESMGDNITVAVHIGRIREKLEDDPASPKLLQTVWGVGYRLRTDAV